jgi:hypothetical protein
MLVIMAAGSTVAHYNPVFLNKGRSFPIRKKLPSLLAVLGFGIVAVGGANRSRPLPL